MKRWLAWGVGGLVAVGVLVRLGASSEKEKAPSADRASSPGVVRPTPAPLADERYRDVLLKDDALPAPPEGAPETQRKIFEETLSAIQKGQDPILPKTGRDALPAELKARLEKRRVAAQERIAKNRGALEERRAKALQRKTEAQLRAGQTPRPPGERRADDPSRLEPPNLGAPLEEKP